MKSQFGDRKSEILEWEVLPPESKDAKPVEPLFRWIALLMDNLIRLPGTQFRIGIDPLIGLIPGLGDTGSAMVSALALIQAARQGLPKIVLARMSLNILLNEIIGVVPVFGDAFSFWFKSNARNYELVREHLAGAGSASKRRSRKSDWIFVIGVLLALGVIVCAGIFISLFVLQQLIEFVSRS
ncbi:MAG: DUF4112 domain-containing protein [Chthoniobacterales bacterium]